MSSSMLCRFSSSNSEEGPHQLPSFEPPDALLEADLLEVELHVDTQDTNMRTHTHTHTHKCSWTAPTSVLPPPLPSHSLSSPSPLLPSPVLPPSPFFSSSCSPPPSLPPQSESQLPSEVLYLLKSVRLEDSTTITSTILGHTALSA